MPVPIALAEMNTSLKTGQKSILADIVTQGIKCPSEVELQGRSGLFIDGMALVAGIGKPHGIQTFGDYAVAFQRAVSNTGSLYQEIHVVFDRYVDGSIKSRTRQRRTKTTRPIRWVIENGSVPLPQNWQNFLALPDNKSDLSRFLSEHIVAHAPPDKIIVTGGGFLDEREYSPQIDWES